MSKPTVRPLALIFCLILFTGLTSPSLAQDLKSGAVVQTSPFPVPTADDTTFVVDVGTDLDTACLFRGDGPITLQIDIDRVFGRNTVPVSQLVANGVLGPYVQLILPVFDVDALGAPGVFPERDAVTVNGHSLDDRFLLGENNEWRLNVLRVPVEYLNLPSAPAIGAGPVIPTSNTIEIDIDSLNTAETWCTAIDWAALRFEAARPTVFVHGELESSSAWGDPWVLDLNEGGFLVERTSFSAFTGLETNAEAVGTLVARAQLRFGVDRVNLVAHGRGAVEARLFAESRPEAIERLVHIGALHAGTPLADYIQSGAVQATVVGEDTPLRASVDLARDNAARLTTGFMGSHNRNHPPSADLYDAAVVGIHSDPRPWSVADVLGRLIPGPDDGIAPAVGAAALAPESLAVFETEFDDLGATHTRQLQQDGLYDLVRDEITSRESAPAGSRDAVGFPTPIDLPLPQRGVTIADSVTQGATATFSVDVDGDSLVAMSLLYGKGDLDLTVITPSGQRIDAGSFSDWPGVHFSAHENIDGLRLEVISLDAIFAGVYSIEVRGVRVDNPEGRESFLFSTWQLETDLELTASSPAPEVRADQAIDIAANLEEAGVGLAGATVVARILRPGDDTTEVALSDDGGGAYSGTVPPLMVGDPLEPGTYRIAVVASGTDAAGDAFTRESFFHATVATTTSRILAPHDDFGVDTDGDGIFDYLVIEVGVDIDGLPADPASTSTVTVVGELTRADGAVILATSHNTVTLGSGFHSVPLIFEGQDIFNSGVNGPYRLRWARLVEENGAPLGELLLEERSSVHTTAAYAATDFRQSHAFLIDADLSAFDTDGNGVDDTARATVEVYVDNGGGHTWSAQLMAPDGAPIDFRVASNLLSDGVNTLTLDFDGCRVVADERGRYSFGGLLVFAGEDDRQGIALAGPLAERNFNPNRFECLGGDTGLSVSLDGAPDPATAFLPLTLEATLANDGPTDADNVIFTALLSGIVSISEVSSDDADDCVLGDDSVTCIFERLADGASATVEIVVLPSRVGPVVFEAAVESTSADTDLTDNQDILIIPVELLDRSRSDFDGDGFDDLAIGTPGEIVNHFHGAGGVNVLYGRGRGLVTNGNQLWTQESRGILDDADTDDFFGAAVATGDFNGDGFGDLAIGVPGENNGAGVVQVLYGTLNNGLSARRDQLWQQGADGLIGVAEAGDFFGSALASGDFDGDGYDDLAIGIPGENGWAGAVHILYGSANRLRSNRNAIWTQSAFGESPESAVIRPFGEVFPGDRFGATLTSGDFNADGVDDLAIGAPHEAFEDFDADGNMFTTLDIGVVHVIHGTWTFGLGTTIFQTWHQSSPGLRSIAQEGDLFGSALASGDFDGDGYDDLAVGSIGETIQRVRGAGAVSVIYGFRLGLMEQRNQFWHEGVPEIQGDPAHEDFFGAALAAGDFDDNGTDDLAIGVPGKLIQRQLGAGAVHVLFSEDGEGLTSDDDIYWAPNTAAIPGSPRKLGLFGAALSAADFDGDGHDDLAVGVPGDKIGSAQGAGAALVFYGNRRDGLSKTDSQRWTQAVTSVRGKPETNDNLGASLGGN